MHPHGPATSFCWPSTIDHCWVPIVHILCQVPALSTAASTGRRYKLDSAGFGLISESWTAFNRKLWRVCRYRSKLLCIVLMVQQWQLYASEMVAWINKQLNNYTNSWYNNYYHSRVIANVVDAYIFNPSETHEGVENQIWNFNQLFIILRRM